MDHDSLRKRHRARPEPAFDHDHCAGARRERPGAAAFHRLRRRAGAAAGGPGRPGGHPGLRLARRRPLRHPPLREEHGQRGGAARFRRQPVSGRRAAGGGFGDEVGGRRRVPHLPRELRQGGGEGNGRGAVVRGEAAGRDDAAVRQHRGQPPAGGAGRELRVVRQPRDGRFRQRHDVRVPRGREREGAAAEPRRLRQRRRRRAAVRVRGAGGRGDHRRRGGAHAAPAAAHGAGGSGRAQGARVPAAERDRQPRVEAAGQGAAVRVRRERRQPAVPGGAGRGLDRAGQRSGGLQDLRERRDRADGARHHLRVRHDHGRRHGRPVRRASVRRGGNAGGRGGVDGGGRRRGQAGGGGGCVAATASAGSTARSTPTRACRSRRLGNRKVSAAQQRARAGPVRAGRLRRGVSKRGADGRHKPVRQRRHARHLPASNGSGLVSNLGMVGSFTS